ncbi:MAG: hypothetical protein QXZ71_04645 [Candidatus Caldarchaeum sp.]
MAFRGYLNKSILRIANGMRLLGGLGYVFSLIPFLNIAAPILIGIAWFQMGGRTGQRLFRATGVLMIATFVVAVASALVSVQSLLLIALLLSMSEPQMFDLLPLLGGFLAAFIALAAVGLATFVLELISHFRASGLYASSWFRRAAWMRIATVALLAVLVGVLIIGGESSTFSTAFLIPFVAVGLLSPVFSVIAFFKLPEEKP